MTLTARCWCGNADLACFSPDYFKCARCQTLVTRTMPVGDVTDVRPDEAGLYGKDYWFAHQEQDVGYPNIFARARADLPERCAHWLRALLKYKLPPGRTLELGAAHGGFVALLRLAGFDATGLELSPWIADFARQTFGVPMLQGPIERQPVVPGSLDALVMMDVIEHLSDPVATLSYCTRLLKPDGVFLTQTPGLPEDKTFAQMTETKDYFVNHLKPDEHLYLFSRTAARELFARVGCPHVQFEPAIFHQYDQFFVARRTESVVHSPEAARAALEATPGGRLAGALLDATERRDYFERECYARMDVINGLVGEVERLRAEVERPPSDG